MSEGGAIATSLESREYRDAMSHVAGAVHVVATSDGATRGGFTATAVASVSDRPPTLVVCANAASETTRAILDSGIFSVNALAFDDEMLAEIFAGRTELRGDRRFAEGRWETLETGAPILKDALVAFDCRLRQSPLVATHHLLVGEVVAVRYGLRRRALIYRERAFTGL
ncbi:MAG: flavin reductase [Salinarimonas sp.]|nr:flavin reductase [Salinarimonas sp.]